MNKHYFVGKGIYEKKRKFLAVTIATYQNTGEFLECDINIEGSQLSETEIVEWDMKIFGQRE